MLKHHEYGRAVDWWCLGSVLYEMLCGLVWNISISHPPRLIGISSASVLLTRLSGDVRPYLTRFAPVSRARATRGALLHLRLSRYMWPKSLHSQSYLPLLQALLIKIPDQRLGGGPGDAEDVRRHLFFSDINWEKLERKEVCRMCVSALLISDRALCDADCAAV